MKQKIAKKIQRLFKKVSLGTIGRSFPPGIYEREISDELKTAIRKMRNNYMVCVYTVLSIMM